MPDADNLTIWTATVMIARMIMTVFLWHLTAFVLVMTISWLVFG